MTTTGDVLNGIEASLRVGGRARRRFLQECRDHLADAVERVGEEEAVRRFGDPVILAAQVDTEVATGRAVRSTVLSALAVLAVAWSTLTLVHSADPHATAVALWAVLFFGCAQTAAVATLLAVLRAAAVARSSQVTPADVALLGRRNLLALGFATATLVAAGGALPGQGSAAALLAGPAAVLVAGVAVLRARHLVRHRDGYGRRTVRSPLGDLAAATHQSLGDLGPGALLLAAVPVAAAAAFLWDLLDHGTVAGSVAVAVLEAGMVVLGFALLGPALGLRQRHRAST